MEIIRIPAQHNIRKVRIAVYCRVSTKLEEQEDSLEMQEEAYISLIRIRSDWELVGVYSDSISGMSAEKRPEFMQMIHDALEGKIDRILCKSVSRFSRNAAECEKYTNMLKSKNVAVEFEKEHLSTDDPTSSFIFSLMSAIADNESRSISENVKWGCRERFKRGKYNLGDNRILGYDCVAGKLIPNKDAEAVKLIFTLYLEGRSIEAIRRFLFETGVKTKKGTLITHNDILYILKNETYKGDKLLQKTHPKDLITKKPDPKTPFESKYLTGDHEAIVSRDLWDAVQRKIRENKELEAVVGHRGGQPHFLYGKVFCGECGEPMIRRTWRGHKVWTCRDRNRGKAGNGCLVRNVREEELLTAIDGKEIKKIMVTRDRIEIE